MKQIVAIAERYSLTFEQAAAFTGIGENCLRERVQSGEIPSDCTLKVGTKTLLKRRKLEAYLDSITVI